MQTLAKAMREFINSQDAATLDSYLKELHSEAIQCGEMNVEELMRSIYSLYDAVSIHLYLSTSAPQYICISVRLHLSTSLYNVCIKLF